MNEFEPTFADSPDMDRDFGSPGLDERKVRSMVAQHIADIFQD